jgi:hypothetical protein
MKKRAARPRRPWPPLALAAAAALLWLAPIPAAWIESGYSRGVYPLWQNAATMTGNFLPFALFDLFVIAIGAAMLVTVIRMMRSRAWKQGALRLLAVTAIAALWFQLGWGLNYRRVPIAQSLKLGEAPSDLQTLARFADAVAARTASTAGDLDRSSPITPARLVAELSAGFDRAQRRLGLTRLARAGRPKHSLFNPYFRWAAIDGVTNPFVPETVIVKGLTPAEAYATAAHEWAHLAGFASEDEASFVGWLACLEAGGGAAYNAWLFALMKAAGAAPPDQARAWISKAGPVAARDLNAIRERVLRASPAVRKAASTAYDTFLRANRVESGIASYDEVLQLMLAAAPEGRPRL